MALDDAIRSSLTIPAICAPMFRISNPALVAEACKAGLIGGLPRHNVRDIETFDSWLGEIRQSLDAHRAENPDARIGPVAVNLSRMPEDILDTHLEICERHGVNLFISAMGNPAELTRKVHGMGGKVFHDVTTIRFAEKAIEAGVDGLTCIGAGGGGHSGTINHLALIPRIRAMFDGTIILAGAVSTGAGIRAAEILGADLAYLGTRFIATAEARADAEYKAMLVKDGAADTIYTSRVAGGAANWLRSSLSGAGLDPDALPEPDPESGRVTLPDGLRPWADIWSAGQGIELIDDIPTVAELVSRLRREYVAACAIPDMAEAANG